MSPMQNVASAVVVAYVALAASVKACSYTTHPSLALMGVDALRLPLPAENAMEECAKTAQAYGYTSASIRPVSGSQQVECSIYGDMEQCTKFTLETGASSATNITQCDGADVLTSDTVNLATTAGTAAEVAGVSTSQVPDVAAIGGTISTMKASSADQCVVACAQVVAGCTQVTVGPPDGAGAVTCTFHNAEATEGATSAGSTVYKSLTTTASLPGLGKVAPGDDTAVAAPTPTPVPEVEAPAPTPEPEVAAPAPTPEEEELDVPAPAPEVMHEAGSLHELFYTPTGPCPGPEIPKIPAGQAPNLLTPPEESVEIYTDVVGENGKFPMPFDEIATQDGTYCQDADSTAEKITIGGTFLFSIGGGECIGVPLADDGSPCCEINIWQPNSAGYYYENCSMKQVLSGDGVYWFTTEVPGDESIVGWGADPEPHMHYDLLCSGCADVPPMEGGEYHWWSKFYPYEDKVCNLGACGDPGPEHVATQIDETTFKYDFVFPAGAGAKR